MDAKEKKGFELWGRLAMDYVRLCFRIPHFHTICVTAGCCAEESGFLFLFSTQGSSALSWTLFAYPYCWILSFRPNLVSLDLSFNNLTELLELVSQLSSLQKLRVLVLQGNPLALIPAYRGFVVDGLPQLSVLDDIHIELNERHQFRGLARQPGEAGRGPCSSTSIIEVVLALIRSKGCRNNLTLSLQLWLGVTACPLFVCQTQSGFMLCVSLLSC